MFAWGMSERDIRARVAAGLSPFAWKRSRNGEDAIFLAEVIGERAGLGKLFKMATARWPDWERKKIYTFRGNRLTLLPQGLIKQFFQEGKSGRGLPHSKTLRD